MAQKSVDNGDAAPEHFTSGPSVPVPFETVTAAIRHQVRSHPTSVAAIDLSQTGVRREISYTQLHARAQCLGRRLRQAGVGPRDRVPLVVKRGVEMLVGLYAILLCGAQYVPLDGVVTTQTTVETVVSQSHPKLIVCTEAGRRRLEKMESQVVRGCQLVVVRDEAAEETEEVVDDVDLATPETGCYVIYTSGQSAPSRFLCWSQTTDECIGTTGTPKGVDVTHSNVTNLVCLSPGNLGIRPGTKVGQVLNVGFDMGEYRLPPYGKVVVLSEC